MDRADPVPDGEVSDDSGRASTGDHEVVPESAQGGADVGERVEQDPQPVGRCVGTAEDPLVEHEQDDGPARLGGRHEGGVVMDPEVAREQHEGDVGAP